MSEADTAARSGDLIDNRYRLRVVVGSGGTAQVWAADDERLQRTVALKLLHPHLVHHAGLRARFTAEVLTIAGCSHPNIISVHDVLNERAGYVMEFIDGITLREWLDDRGRLSFDEVGRLGEQMTSALDAAHAAGVIHRDVTPSNILVTPSGVAKLGDFGIARSDDEVGITHTDGVLGTAPYLSPEQLENTEVSPATDTYSLGIVLYETATGSLPFQGSSDAAIAVARLHDTPAPITAHVPDIPRPLATSIMECLRLRPDERTPFTAQTSVAPAAGAAPLTATTPPTPPRTPHRAQPPVAAEAPPASTNTSTPRRRRGGLWLAMVLILVGFSLLVIAGLLSDRSPSSEPPSTTSPTTTVADRLVPISAIATFDPDGTGPAGENDDLVDLLRDNDDTTSWTSERYESRDFGNKRGIGLVLTAPTDIRSARIEIDTPHAGWSGLVAVSDSAPSTPPTDGVPLHGSTSPLSIPLSNEPGDHLVIWITSLATTGPPTVEISELRWFGVDAS